MRSKAYLRALFALSVLLPTAVFVVNSSERYSRITALAEIRAEGGVSILQEHALKVFETQELVLDLVQDIIAETPGDALRLPAASARLATLASRLEQTVSVWIADAAGLVIAGSMDWPPGWSVAEQEFFRTPRDQVRPYFISARYVGKLTGEPSFAMARRRHSADGSFAGTIHVAISPLYFEEYFRRLDRAGHGAALLFRGDGEVLAGYPMEPTPHPIPVGTALLRAAAAQPEGGLVRARSPLDRQDRLYAFRRIGPFDVHVAYGESLAAAHAEWREATLLRGLGAVLFITLLGGTTWLVAQSLATRQRALEALRAEIARRQAMEQQLQDARALESLGRMARGVAHDFNNLLTVVLGHLETLGQEARDASGLRAVEGARKASEAGAQLAASLLAYAHTQVLRIETFQVEPFLRGLVDLLQEIATPSRPITLDIAAGLPACRADLSQLQACLHNLVTNARDATEPGAALVLTARPAALDAEDLAGNPEAKPGRFVAISLTDPGHGMAPETAARAFEPFFTTKAGRGGTGLGLSQVFGLMRQLEGHAAIRTAPGNGTSVTLFLPALAAEAPHSPNGAPATPVAAPAPSLAEATAPPAPSILVVDDQPEVSRVVEAILQRAGYAVRLASGAEAALALLREGMRVDLVLSDVVMPDEIDGIGLLHRLRESHPGLRVLLMSGYAPGLERLGGLAVDVVRKPFTRKTLTDAVEAALAEQPVAGPLPQQS